VLGRGKVIADAPVSTIEALAAGDVVRVRTPDAERFAALLVDSGVKVTATGADLLQVSGIPAPRIGELAAQQGIVLHELTPVVGSLEDAYLALTQDEVEYHAGEMVVV